MNRQVTRIWSNGMKICIRPPKCFRCNMSREFVIWHSLIYSVGADSLSDCSCVEVAIEIKASTTLSTPYWDTKKGYKISLAFKSTNMIE